MVITPPQVHIRVDVLFNAGILAIITVGEPGVQGAAVTGIQGMGVNTPKAAAVAEATVGLANDMHMAKGMMLTIGMLSMMLASGIFEDITRFVGSTTNEEGAVPNEHIRLAPIQTCCGMAWVFGEF